MEYTNDVIFNVEYKGESECVNSTKNSRFNKLLKIFEKDSYFTLTIIVSIIFLFIDYLIINRFIEILNLL